MPLQKNIGTVLHGKFRIVQVLGEGGMGTVYKVEDVDMPGFYRAVKELLTSPDTSAEEQKSAEERFNKEIDLLSTLKHPHIALFIINFKERDRDGHDHYYYVMEFVPGKSLDKLLEERKAPLDEDQVIKWMIQVCDALSYIHTRTPPIILRDLKPGNIMVMPDGNVQLIDFGIARRFDPNKKTNTENLGTISYASPEHLGSMTRDGQRRSKQNPGTPVQTDARSDIYSLGATMYHLLTNHEPEPIQTPVEGSIVAKNPRLRTTRAGNTIFCPIEKVIIKAMQQNPAQRFQSAEAMSMALQQCLSTSPASLTNTTRQIPATVSPNATVIVPISGPICPKCGLQNRPGARFCKRDGQPLVQGAITVPPQARMSPPSVSRAPLQARPVTAPPQPIRARPVSPNTNTSPAANTAVAYQLGLQYLQSRNYEAAISQFKLAQAQGQSSYDLCYNLGRAYRLYAMSFKENNPTQYNANVKLAAEQFEAAARLKPDAVNACFEMGICYRELELYRQAEAAFKKAKELAPRDPANYYQLGQVAIESGFLREAEGYFLEGLQINPDHTQMLVALGHLYIKMNQPGQAVNTLLEATQRDPDSAEGWYALGRAQIRNKQWKAALNALEKARQINPTRADVYSAMALCYQKLNRKQETMQMVQAALQRDQNNGEAQRIKKQL